jgi:anaerobic ribonucleoside-triphosphate reductase activating protein
MNINALQIGYGVEIKDKISLNIYLSGCFNNKKCDRDKCHNQGLHNFNTGKFYLEYLEEIEKIINQELVDCVCLLGGEPFDQALNSFNDLIYFLSKCKKNIYIYTGYTKNQLQELKKEYLLNNSITNVCYGEFKENIKNKKWLY